MRVAHHRLGLVAFDVDGTILRGPTVCECIAEGIGKLQAMQAFEQLTAKADIARARMEMAEWYRPFDRETLSACVDRATLAPGTREGFAALRRAGLKIALVSITWQFAVERLAHQLGADHAVGTALTASGEVAHFWPDDKVTWTTRYLARAGHPKDAFAAVGDSLSDLPMLLQSRRGYFVGTKPVELPAHVLYWPDADISEIVADLLAADET
jgi:phosphoserine phosphatase